MNQLFTSGHQQLFDTQCSGLSAAWRRAAEESARQPARAPGQAADRRLRSALRVGLVTVAGATLFAAVWSALPGTGPDAPRLAAPVATAVDAPPRLPA